MCLHGLTLWFIFICIIIMFFTFAAVHFCRKTQDPRLSIHPSVRMDASPFSGRDSVHMQIASANVFIGRPSAEGDIVKR